MYCFILQLYISGCFHFSFSSGHNENCSSRRCVKIKYFRQIVHFVMYHIKVMTYDPAELSAIHPYKGVI